MSEMRFTKIAGTAATAIVAFAIATSVAVASPVHHHRYYRGLRVNPAPAIGPMIGTFVGAAVGAAAMSEYGYEGPGPYGYAPMPYYAPPPYYGPPSPYPR
jgi:hypothetical protein